VRENPEKRNHWQRHVEALKAGGLTRRAYCEKNQIKLSTLDYWCQKLGHEEKQRNEIGWVPLQISEEVSSSGIDLRIGRIIVTVKPGFDPALLTELLRTIGALC